MVVVVDVDESLVVVVLVEVYNVGVKKVMALVLVEL
jgi:hypothetical protein